MPRQPPPEAPARLRDLGLGVSAALRLHGTMRSLDALAHRDALTGLGNRRAFDARLAAPPGEEGFTLLLLDLDGFKGVNDRFGHPAGDAVLREAARRLATSTRRTDTCFRLGGDEFALLVPEALIEPEALALGHRIHAAFAEPFAIDGVVVPLRTSVGAAALLGDPTGDPTGDVASAASLVPRADAALYEAKRAGRGTTRFAQLSPAGDGNGPSRPRLLADSRTIPASLGLEARLRRALVPPGAEPFTLAFQPVVDLRCGRIASIEALVRWSPQPGGAVSPGEFVPLAERTGLVPHLDRWVLRAACTSAASWPVPWSVSVNVSAVTFGLANVAGLVQDVLGASGLAPERLVVEMTEAAAVADEARAWHAVEAVRALGAHVALDDFGGGHASLAAIRRYPFSAIKVGRALVAGLDRDPVASSTLAFVAEIGAMLGLAVVAEGVERGAELRAVRDCGVTGAQGYLIAKPVAAGELASGAARAEAACQGTLHEFPIGAVHRLA